MERFTKNAIILMIGLVVFMVTGTYIGAVALKGDMETKYAKVMEEEAEAAHLSLTNLVELNEAGEYIGFTIAGAMSGLAVGYLWPTVFGQKRRAE
jgi:hypothetical protein